MNSTKMQRFVAYLIDYVIIIGFTATLLKTLVCTIFKIDLSQISYYQGLLTEEMKAYSQSIMMGSNYDVTRLIDLLFEYVKYLSIESAIIAVFHLLLIIGYFVILPMYWSNQTLGRYIMKVKVVSLEGSNLSKKQIILREIVGTFLLYSLIGGILIPISGLIALAKERSLVDYIARTKLVSTLDVPTNDNDNKDYMDAKFKEADNDEYEDRKYNDADSDEYVDAKFVDDDEPNDPAEDDSDDYKII